MKLTSLIPPQYRILALVLALVLAIGVACGAGFWSAWAWRSALSDVEISGIKKDLAEANQKAEKDARKIESLSDAVTSRNADILALRDSLREEKNNTTTREVIKYVQSDPDAGSCVHPDGWVRLYNTSARGVPEAGQPASRGDDPATSEP